MISESELVARLCEFLTTSDLNTTTTATVRLKLEEDFGIDLSDKKTFIRQQVDLFLQNQVNQQDDEQDEVEEGEGSSNSKAIVKRRSKKRKKEVKKRGGGGGFTKLCGLSPQLQKFTGVPELARTEVVKLLWNHIRENNLQDPSKRTNIICDETFRDLFAVDSINMFQMNKALSEHIWPLNSDGAPTNNPPKDKQPKQEKEEDPDEPKRKAKRQKGGNTGILAPIPLSDALIKFLGTGETALSRADVIKRIWNYIKENNLQDPSDKRRIISDEKLKELFDVDTFTGFTVAKLLTAHFIKAEQNFMINTTILAAGGPWR